MWKFLKKLFGIEDPPPPRRTTYHSSSSVSTWPSPPSPAPAPPPPPPSFSAPEPVPEPEPEPLWSSLELVSAPQHGKTSFLWALSFMARKLGLVWPEYVFWPQDDTTDESFRSMLRTMDHRELPAEATPSSQLRLSLRGME